MCVRLAFYTFIELSQQADRFFCAVLPNAVRSLEKEVIACIFRRDMSWIEDGKVTNSRKDKVLEDGRGCGGGGDEEDVRGFKCALSRGCP